jgi:hypothetical protein
MTRSSNNEGHIVSWRKCYAELGFCQTGVEDELGFADDLLSRLGQHRTAAPTAVVVKSWPCKRAWEGTVMDCLTAVNCRLILNEVFECDDVDALIARADKLFDLLPDPAAKAPLADVSPHNT